MVTAPSAPNVPGRSSSSMFPRQLQPLQRPSPSSASWGSAAQAVGGQVEEEQATEPRKSALGHQPTWQCRRSGASGEAGPGKPAGDLLQHVALQVQTLGQLSREREEAERHLDHSLCPLLMLAAALPSRGQSLLPLILSILLPDASSGSLPPRPPGYPPLWHFPH